MFPRIPNVTSYIPNSYERQNIFEEARSGHVTCNIWAWVCLHGVGCLSHIDGRFTAAKYLEILEEEFLPSLRERDYPFPGRIVFMHDRCPVHTAHIVQRWFADRPDLELLDWPSRGCDMNPIENIWANMVNTWKPQQERTTQQLRQHVDRVWGVLEGRPDLVRNHILSMHSRLQEVVEAQGGWSSY